MTDDQKAPSARLAPGCHRSHPHENMSPLCEAKTIRARLESLHRRYLQMPEYTQGVCADGAAILEDGRMLTIEEILDRLRHPPGFSVPAILEETAPDQGMQQLAFKIADESAVALLECNLMNATLGGLWLDTASAEPADDPAILEAIEYLELRGMLEHHPTSYHLVRIIEQETTQ